MFGLNMVLDMGNLLWIISTFSALPTATIILEHEVVHQDVQTLYCFSIGSYIKMVTFIWSILNMNIAVNGLNLNYSCLWFIIACLVGQCLWQIIQEKPEVETCLASMWFCIWLSLIGFRLVDYFSEKIIVGPHEVPDPPSLAQMTFTQCTSMSELKIDPGAPPGGQI